MRGLKLMPRWSGLWLLLVASTAQGQASDSERFQLYNACRPMNIAGFVLVTDAASALDLTEDQLEDRIRNAVESRVRSARLYYNPTTLYDPDSANWFENGLLKYDVQVLGPAFSVTLEYVKPVQDLATGRTEWGSTWDEFTMGTHGNDSDFIVSTLSGFMDQFLIEYLRVNEAAC